MEFHERMGIAHKLHTFWNPVSEEVVDELLWALDLQPGMRVLDVACGVGEMLMRMVAGYEVQGVGVDISPWALERARAMQQETLSDADLEFVESDGKSYPLPDGKPFDVVSLIGASWIWDGYRGTLAALHDLVRPDGLVLLGEPYWKTSPPEAYLEAAELKPESFTDLGGLHAAVEEAGFRLLYQVVSTGQDWDRYEMLQSLSMDRWAAANPDHPDRTEVLAIQVREQGTFLNAGRETLGFTQMILRRID